MCICCVAARKPPRIHNSQHIAHVNKPGTLMKVIPPAETHKFNKLVCTSMMDAVGANLHFVLISLHLFSYSITVTIRSNTRSSSATRASRPISLYLDYHGRELTWRRPSPSGWCRRTDVIKFRGVGHPVFHRSLGSTGCSNELVVLQIGLSSLLRG